ncbi:MAG: radical SAM/SPASM domain-containing protein [Candidatus Bathyarchaeia archaeon]
MSPISLRKALGVMSRALTPNRPYHVQWMVTRKCNYRCAGCNVWREQDANELSAEEIKRGLDILRKLGVLEIVISGGNPLLRSDIDEIIEYASRFFITTVYDNGSMAAEKIDALRNADFVAISIDSLNPEKNDSIKGVKGAWKTAINAVEKLHSEGINVSVSPTISQANLYEITDFTNYFASKGIPIWYCLYSYDLPEQPDSLFKIGKANDVFLIDDKEAVVKLCHYLLDMKRKSSNILMTTKVLEAVKALYADNKRTWKCRALRNFFVINHLGQVSGCHIHEPVASIFELPKVWESDKFNALREKYSQCERCTYLCYIFYSLHGSVRGNLQIAKDRWRSAKLFLKRS